MSSNIPPSPRKQLCTRSCSNKHTKGVCGGIETESGRGRKWKREREWEREKGRRNCGHGGQVFNHKQLNPPCPALGRLQIPAGLVLWACTCYQPDWSFGFDSKREGAFKTGRHPVLKYRVPHGSQCVMGRLVRVHTGPRSLSLVAHVPL
jgi:hypothetical protein